MSDIFISYARPDRPKAEQLAHAFERQGWSVWWDRELVAGSKFADVISSELSNARAVIALWSQSSVASNWVKDEAQEGAGRGILIPVLLDKISLPLGFRQFQAADLSDWDGTPTDQKLSEVLRGVAELIKKPVTDAPTGRGRTPRRQLPVYLVVGAVLCLALAFAAYKYFTRTADGGGTVGNKQCTADSRHKAAKFTSDGILMIDPGGNYDAAVLQFKEAIAECDDYADAYFWRGQSLVALNRSDEALKDFKTYLDLKPEPGAQLHTAQKLVADLEGPHTTTTPTPANTNGGTTHNTNATPPHNTNAHASNMNGSNMNAATNTNTSNSNTTTPGSDLPHVQVADIFASDRVSRIYATTRLIAERKQDAAAVKQAVASALAHPDNKSGVINTLVYLENVDPAILKQQRPEIEKLFAVAEGNGPQTVEHIKKVQARLGG